LDDRFCRNGAAARAALFIKKIHDFAEGIGVRGIPEIGALAAHMDEADLFQFFQVVRKSRSGNAKLFLHFAGNHAVGVSGKKETENLKARLRAKRGEAVGGACDEKGIGLPHISIIAEIWNDVKHVFTAETLSIAPAS
jgi:hypothetical protein